MPNSISIDASKLKALWVNRVISDKAYVYLALCLEQRDRLEEIDIEAFIIDWQAENGENVKSLSEARVKSALAVLEERELISCHQSTKIAVL